MSEQDLINENSNHSLRNSDVYDDGVIDLYEPRHIPEELIQENVKPFYYSLDFPLCSKYSQPSLQPIIDKKAQMNKNFMQGREQQFQKLSHFDGIYENNAESFSENQLIRLMTRLIRDRREQYFQQNSEFIVERNFYYEQLSRLANISFEKNKAIDTFQKNAILSERNNQKKNTPFELEINLGCIWLTGHPLQNQQQKKFEQLRPLLREYSNFSTYPILPQLSKQLAYLQNQKEMMLENKIQPNLELIVKKIQMADQLYQKERSRVERVMRQIIQKWKQIKEIRRETGMQTVPYKLNIKQFEIDDLKNYDIGITQIQVSDRINSEKEIQRRQEIRSQRYMAIVYINGFQVAKTGKVYLQWPSYRVYLNQKINVTVYSAPSSVQVEIVKLGVINKTVDTINLMLPGLYSKTITSSERRFACSFFCSNGSKHRKNNESVESPSGFLVYKIQWKGQGSRMPPVSFKSQEEQTAPTQESQESLEYQEFSEFGELFDGKDPRVHWKNKNEEVDDQIIKGKGALLPFVDTQSARHLLLKMKASQPQFQKLNIPLTQEQIRKRQDLLAVIQKQKQKTLDNVDSKDTQIYNPSEGIFRKQDEEIIKEIKDLLFKIQTLKLSNSKNTSSAKYKITEQIVKEYIFEQMESPIVVFLKNLFTQKRKLGPQTVFTLQAQTDPKSIEINVHVRSAKHVPIRETAFAKIRHFQEEEERMNNFRMQQMAMHTGNVELLTNYGTSFYPRPPNMNLQGQNFYIPGLRQNEMRPNFQVNYQKIPLERNSTYVELRFKKTLKRTECFEGPYPEWNETIEFQYNFQHQQMTIKKLHANNERTVELFLFDMIEESKPTTSIAEARIKKTKYFLGRVQFPLSMMVSIPSLTGGFALERPLIIFGYGIKKAGLFDREETEQANKTQSPDTTTLLNLDIFSQPLLDSMHAYNEDRKFVTGAQSPLLLQKASDWLSDLNTKMYLRLWLNNIEGKSVFICRYLSENIAPPPHIENNIERCARFVSMIPKKYNCKLLQNTEQFHLTCDQMLNIKMGEDHGILLCNYFNYIDRKQNRIDVKSYLVIGKAFPYGKSIFVLRKNHANGDCQLWDPYAGNCYFFEAKQYDFICCLFKYSKKKDNQSKKDVCNMFELTSIVTPTNVYINVQESLKPLDIDFNFQDDKLWKPFLTERMTNQYFERSVIETIQPEITQDFYPRPSGLEHELKVKIFQFIRGNLESQRKKHFKPYTFKLNTDISHTIQNKMLIECENFKLDYRLTGQDSTLYQDFSPDARNRYNRALDELQQQKNRIKTKVYSDRNLYGVTLNTTFTTLQDIWTRVQQVQAHLDETQDISFVLGVRCFELACHVFSVWVFIGSEA